MIRTFTDKEVKDIERSNPDVHTCPTCQGRASLVDCDCRQQRQLRMQYSHAGIGLAYQRLTWEDFARPVPSQISDFLSLQNEYVSRGIGLFLYGGHGTGKTMLANLVLKELVRNGYDCYATTFAQTIEQMCDSWRDAEDKRRFEKRFMLSQVLLLDDFGKHLSTASKLAPSTFDHILRTRVQEARSTIVTSNQSPDTFELAVLSMLAEQSITSHLEGADYRPSAHKRAISEVRDGIVRKIV